MVHRAVIAALCAGVLLATSVASAATPVRGQTLMPGVVYSRQLDFTAHGPVALNVIVAPRPTGAYALKSILSNDAVQGTERLTSMERRSADDATVAAVTAGATGVLRDGVLDVAPAEGRSTVGVGSDGTLHVDRVDIEGTWQGSGQRRILGINEAPRANRTTLYTRAWGARTPAESGGAYAILQPFPPSRPNTPLTTIVAGYASGGNQPIPAGGAVLVARGSQAGFLSGEAPAGSKVTIMLTLTPTWSDVVDAVGGGPAIVRNARPVYRAFENFAPEQLAYRNARSAVGQTADGRIVLVVADGRQRGYSMGLTNFELALAMMRLGCVTASALSSGPSATMAFDAKLLNRPSARVERAAPAALGLFYYGVYIPPPARKTYGLNDAVPLSYRLVRPSSVTVQLVGPGGAAVAVDAGSRSPGVYRLAWPAAARTAGEWTFRVTAEDDLGRRSSADRDVTLK